MLRPARPDDARAILSIYGPLVDTSIITFETSWPSESEVQARIAKAHLWLVEADENDDVLGYCYAGPFKERAAYRWSVETSVYLAERARGRGLAPKLYAELFRQLKERGYHQAYAGVALPNEASVKLHEKVGFRQCGTFPKVGFKFGRWIDVAWFHLELLSGDPDENR